MPEGFPYLNEYHKRHSEAMMALRSKQPLRSAQEAYVQYDRLKAGQQRRSVKPSTLLNRETTSPGRKRPGS